MRPHCIAGTQIDGLHIEAFGSVIEFVKKGKGADGID